MKYVDSYHITPININLDGKGKISSSQTIHFHNKSITNHAENKYESSGMLKSVQNPETKTKKIDMSKIPANIILY